MSYWRDLNINGIEICGIQKSSHIFPNHVHDNVYAFSLMENGGSYWNEKKSEDSLIKPGDIALINPGLVHSGAPVENKHSTYKMIYIDLSLMKKISYDFCEKNDRPPEFDKVVINNPQLSDFFRQLYTSFTNDSELLKKDVLLTSFLGKMIMDHNAFSNNPISPGNELKSIKKAIEYLSEKLDQKVSLQDVATAAGLSRYHFLRVFKKSTGITPHHYRTQKRIDRAKIFMLRGMPLTQVALESGFTDQSHLTNKFKQYTGVTPKQYLMN